MPKKQQIKKVLVIGSGPIVIGQAAEFDYAGTQACRALKEDGIEIVLINSNPATIMTDNTMADRIYIEPLTLATVKRIIEKEKPDSILSGMGGQTGLTLCMQLAKDGFLESNNVTLLGAKPEAIDKAEDRQLFKDAMERIGQPCIPSKVVVDVEAALNFAKEIGYPVIVRPAFTLGGSGGGIAKNEAELKTIAKNGIYLSPINQILVERCVSGWKEIEFEMMRDGAGNTIVICSMENLDPVGIHTGDSIVVAPALTLARQEYSMLSSAAKDIVNELGIEGGCNVQFALHPTSFEYAVIEVNPRVSRSSALASKATGYPIAKVATKIAIGYALPEILNTVTGKTFAIDEPVIDYVAVKFPKWAFDKFVYAKKELGTQMKATGEVMAIAHSFECALLKAVRGAEIGQNTLELKRLATKPDQKIAEKMQKATDERIFAVFEWFRRGLDIEKANELTKIDRWFLSKIKGLSEFERAISGKPLTIEDYLSGKKLGYTDSTLKELSGHGFEFCLKPTYKTVDTCAGRVLAATPYFYSVYQNAPTTLAGTPLQNNEALPFIKPAKERIVVLGSGPIRIGQGIEFDYSSVHCVRALKKMGYEVIIINNNPETVSTDFDTADRLYFEPLTKEDVKHIIDLEQPLGVIVAFGGQTAIKLTQFLSNSGVRILGTSADSIDMAEDRDRFDRVLEECGIKRPKGFAVKTEADALKAAKSLKYPVLMRPSYVLGGHNMIIAFNDEDIKEYMGIIMATDKDNTVLIDKYLSGTEIEVDVISDGEDFLIPGIMEQVERTGVHSGDSIAIYPMRPVEPHILNEIVDTTKKLCQKLKIIGLINIQYIIADDKVFVIEVNPRASRTIPYMSKVTNIPICELATKVIMGKKLKDLGAGVGLAKKSGYTAVKVPVFSFEKLIDVDTHLGPEMKSTGEVLGIGYGLKEALYKGLLAAGNKMKRGGGVFITVRDADKADIVGVAAKLNRLGFDLYATEGTATALRAAKLPCQTVNKIHQNEGDNNIALLESGSVNYVISTSTKGRDPERDSVKIRRHAALLGIPCLTSPDTANALADILMSKYNEQNVQLFDLNQMKFEKTT